METISLGLGERSYDICIGQDLLADRGLVRSAIRGKRVFVVSNETVASLYLQKLVSVLDGLQPDWIVIPDGEQYKTLDTFSSILSRLLENNHNRYTTLIALGGGVVGDITGFAAACFQRGVPYIQIPTTLLSQVDSSVGGKTAVNHPLGKNMIGAFHQPEKVLVDIDTLNTLPKRELIAGMAEVIKHGAIADANFFLWLEENFAGLLSLEKPLLAYAIKRSCEIKAAVVSADEKEKGQRALLNFGHTFGHAIENLLGYGEWLHGEAVGVGMVMAADLSHRLQLLSTEAAQRIKFLVEKSGLPIVPPASIDAKSMMTAMRKDKKADDSGLRFVLLNDIGKAELVTEIPEEKLLETLSAKENLCES